MDAVISLLDKNYRLCDTRVTDSEIILYISSTQEQICCPYCGTITSRVHSYHTREIQIVFMMWIASYDEPYSNGYFIDGKGTKHIYKCSGVMPMYPVEDEYTYLLEHYDEFETMAYFDDETLKKCAEC